MLVGLGLLLNALELFNIWEVTLDWLRLVGPLQRASWIRKLGVLMKLLHLVQRVWGSLSGEFI